MVQDLSLKSKWKWFTSIATFKLGRFLLCWHFSFCYTEVNMGITIEFNIDITRKKAEMWINVHTLVPQTWPCFQFCHRLPHFSKKFSIRPTRDSEIQIFYIFLLTFISNNRWIYLLSSSKLERVIFFPCFSPFTNTLTENLSIKLIRNLQIQIL